MTGKFPNGWKVAKLEDVVDILDNKRVPINSKEREARQGPIPYYGATGQVGWIDDFLFDEELVLLGEDGAPFFDFAKQKAYVVRGKSWVNNHAHVLRAKNGISNAYIKYYLDIVDYHGFVTGTTRHKLNQAAMRQIPIPIAPPEQQQRIVAEIEKQFSRLDEAVANLKRVKANLKRYKAAVLKAAVEGRLVETEAELARREGRSYQSGAQLLQRILETRRSQWKGKGKYKEPAAPDATDLPELPEGWVWLALHQITDLENGDRSKNYPSRAAFVEKGIPFINAGHIEKGQIEMAEMNFISEDRFAMLRAGKIQKNDLLFCLRGSLGKVAIVRNLERGAIASSLVIVRPVEDVMPEYLLCYLMSTLAHEQIRLYDNGSAQPNLSAADLGKFVVPVPPVTDQHRIIAEVDRRFSLVRETEAQVDANLQRAKRLHQSTLKTAFTGLVVPQIR